jgi:hypothetical protein
MKNAIINLIIILSCLSVFFIASKAIEYKRISESKDLIDIRIERINDIKKHYNGFRI